MDTVATRKMVCCLLVFAWFSSAVFGLTPAEKARAQELLNETFPNDKPLDRGRVAGLGEEERRLLIEVLRDYLAPFSDDKETLWLKGENRIFHLEILGDDWARQAYVEQFLKEGGHTPLLERLYDPKMIPMVGEHLFENEEFKWADDVGHPPIQHNVAEMMVETLGNSPSFNSDVINWARRLRVEGWTVELLRDWYRANETMLKVGDYKAVQPGGEPPERKRLPSVDRQPPLLPLPVVSSAVITPRPGTVEAPDSSGYLWIAGLLLAICGSLVWLLRHKRN